MQNSRNPKPAATERQRTGTARVALVLGAFVVLGGVNGLTADAAQTEPPVHAVVPAGDYAEDHPLLDRRIDGNGVCGAGAVVPVPDASGVLSYEPWQDAPAPLWRLDR